MSVQLITIKSVKLNNNCPECFSKEGLQITFKQRYIETAFYKKITQEVTTQMNCIICDTQIHPARWTEDIERVYEYQMKAFKPKKASKKNKGLFWVIILLVGLIIASAIGFIILKLN